MPDTKKRGSLRNMTSARKKVPHQESVSPEMSTSTEAEKNLEELREESNRNLKETIESLEKKHQIQVRRLERDLEKKDTEIRSLTNQLNQKESLLAKALDELNSRNEDPVKEPSQGSMLSTRRRRSLRR